MTQGGGTGNTEAWREQVHSDNDASELDILGQFGRLFDEFEALGEMDDCFPSHFQPFSLIIGSLKKTRYGPTDRHTHGLTDRQNLS